MNAFVLTGHGDLNVLVYHTDWPTPSPGPDDVLIRVGACGLNNTDVNTRSGWYSKAVTEATTGDAYTKVNSEDPTWGGAPIVFPRIQGADAVGTVVAAGEQADASLIGKRVIVDGWLRDWNDPGNRNKSGYFGSECDGGFAEYATADHRNVHAIESSFTDAELATFSCSYSTAEGMLSRAEVTSDDVVLIPGASGGVGSALVQLAKLRGARVVAMASESKHAEVAKLNPDAMLPRNVENLPAALQQAIGADTVSVVADVVGGDYFSTLIDRLERGGRYTCSGAIAGPMVELDLRTFYLRDLTFTGSTVLSTDVFPRLVSYIEAGKLQPMLAKSFPLSDLKIAQQAFIDKKHTGNLVVIP
jgi:NADPH:quinone reductase-like Zn-dependent oxidoreductase